MLFHWAFACDRGFTFRYTRSLTTSTSLCIHSRVDYWDRFLIVFHILSCSSSSWESVLDFYFAFWRRFRFLFSFLAQTFALQHSIIFKSSLLKKFILFFGGFNFFFYFTQFNYFYGLNFSYMAADVKLLLLLTILTWFLTVEGVGWHYTNRTAGFYLKNYSVHSENWSGLFVSLKELFAPNCTSYYVAH